MLQAVLLAGIAGGIVAVGLWKYQQQSAGRREEEEAPWDLDAQTIKKRSIELRSHPLSETSEELLETWTFYQPVKPTTLEPIPEELGPDLDVKVHDKACTEPGLPSPTTFERMFEALWSGVGKPAMA